MRHLLAVLVTAFVVSVAMVSPPVGLAAAETPPAPAPAPAPAPTPAPTPAPPKPADCAACVQCVAGCTPAYLDCTRKCIAQPDLPSQQACVAKCPSVPQCIQACPCSGCTIPGMPH